MIGNDRSNAMNGQMKRRLYLSRSMKTLRKVVDPPTSPWRNPKDHEKYYLNHFDMRINGLKEAWYREEVGIRSEN